MFLTQKKCQVIIIAIIFLLFVKTVYANDITCSQDRTITLRSDGIVTIDGRKSYVSGNPQFDSTTLVPGDIVCIQSNSSGSNHILRLINLSGDSNNPISFVNSGGKVEFNKGSDVAISVRNSKFLRISGTGDKNYNYGFKINGGDSLRFGKGIKIFHRSSDIELDHIEITNIKKIGILTSLSSNCSDGSVPAKYGSGPYYYPQYPGPYFDEWGREVSLKMPVDRHERNEMHDYNANGYIFHPKTGEVDPGDVTNKVNGSANNLYIHHNYIHNTGTEGLYIGSNRSYRLYKINSNPNDDPYRYPGSGMNGRALCQYGYKDNSGKVIFIANGDDEPINGHLDKVVIHNNTIEYTGWDSINVKSSARNCNIFDNNIKYFASKDAYKDQVDAINLQVNVNCNIYRNSIINGNGAGIYSQGVGGIISNNLIIEAGKGKYHHKSGIMTSINTDPNRTFWVNETWQELPWSKVFFGFNYRIFSNTIIDPVNYGISFYIEEESHSILNNVVTPQDNKAIVVGTNTSFDHIENNVTVIPDKEFIDPTKGDYHLTKNSSLIDSGSDLIKLLALPTELIEKDLDLQTRPKGNGFDIGSYEYTPPSLP